MNDKSQSKDAAGVARAISRKLAALGFPRGTFGKYRIFGAAEGAVEGFMVHRIGFSQTISVGWIVPDMYTVKASTDRAKAKSVEIREAVRKMGYEVNEYGHIDCDKIGVPA